MRLLKKGCPRCQGDLTRVDDIGDTYYSCVQCGHIMYHLIGTDRSAARTTEFEAERLRRQRAA